MFKKTTQNYHDSTKSDFDNFVDNHIFHISQNYPSLPNFIDDRLRALGNKMANARACCYKTFACFMIGANIYENNEVFSITCPSVFFKVEIEKRLAGNLASFLKKKIIVSCN